jgi:hypothetical protein
MSDTLGVKISADVSSLQASLAIAKAEMQSFGREMNSLARQAAADGLTADLQSQLSATAAQFVAAQKNVHDLSNELEHAGGIASNFHERLTLSGKSLEEFRLRIADYTNLATGFGELLAVGFGGERILELAKDFGELGDAISTAMKQTGLSAEELSALRLVGQENDVEFQSLTRAMTNFARGMEQAQTGSRQQLAAFDALGISASELKAHGNDLGFMLQLVASRLNQYADGGNKSAIETAIFGGRIQGLAPILADIGENGMAGLKRHAEELGVTFNKDMTEEAKKVHESFIDLKAAAEGLANSIGEELAPAIAAANRGWTSLLANMHKTDLRALESQMDGLHDTIEKLKEAQTEHPDAIVMGKPIQQALDAAYAKYSDLQGKWQKLNDEMVAGSRATAGEAGAKPSAPSMADAGNELQQFRAGLADFEANFAGTHAELMAKVAQLWREEVSSGKLAGTELLEAKTASANAEKQLATAVGENAIAVTRNQISAVGAAENVGAVQRLEQQRQEWAQLLAGDKLTADQRIEAQRNFNDVSAALVRAKTTEANAIARSDADTDIAISRQTLEAKKQSLSEEASAHLITVQQEFDQLRAIANQEEALDEQRLQSRLAMLKNEPAEYETVYNQIRELRAKLNTDLAQMDRQQQIAAANEAKQEVTAWKSAVNEIGSAEQSLVSGILSSQQRLSTTALQITGQLVEKEIANDLKYFTMRTLLGNSDAATQRARESAGVLVHLTTEGAKTNATVANNSIRAASDASSQTSFLGRIGEMLAGWLGFETSKTAATVSGEAAGRAAAVASGLGQIQIDAAVAAAGAMAAISAIPFVGPALAPEIAAATYAETIGWAAGLGGAGLAQGTNLVPDDMITLIHAGERVVPAADNAALMSAVANGGGAGNGDVHVHFDVTAMDSADVSRLIKKQGPTLAKAVVSQVRIAGSTLRNQMAPA